MLHFTTSVCDAASAPSPGEDVVRPWACPECASAFPCEKALKCHLRQKHEVRALQRLSAPADGVCMSCSTRFGSRLALLTHLCETRAGRAGHRCWEDIRARPRAFRPLAAASVRRLDLLDRQRRRDERREGHAHPLAMHAATRADGRVLGRCIR